MSPELPGGFFTTEPSGKPVLFSIYPEVAFLDHMVTLL